MTELKVDCKLLSSECCLLLLSFDLMHKLMICCVTVINYKYIYLKAHYDYFVLQSFNIISTVIDRVLYMYKIPEY